MKEKEQTQIPQTGQILNKRFHTWMLKNQEAQTYLNLEFAQVMIYF